MILCFFKILFATDVGVVKLSHPFFFFILVRNLKIFLQKSAFLENSWYLYLKTREKRSIVKANNILNLT